MNILLIGGNGGIGQGLMLQLHEQLPSAQIIATWHRQQPALHLARVHWVQCDVACEASVSALASECEKQLGDIHWCINTVGILHKEDTTPEKAINQLSEAFFLENIKLNTLPTLLLAKHLGKRFDKTQAAIFATISAKVGSIEDNRLGGWYSYRSSKAAVNMALKTLSIEWQRKLPKLCVAAIHPGTTKTQLSAPFTRNTPSDKLFSTERTARQIVEILRGLRPADTGKFWSWDGSELPW